MLGNINENDNVCILPLNHAVQSYAIQTICGYRNSNFCKPMQCELQLTVKDRAVLWRPLSPGIFRFCPLVDGVVYYSSKTIRVRALSTEPLWEHVPRHSKDTSPPSQNDERDSHSYKSAHIHEYMSDI